ncbi:hypothetical protein KAU32_06785 [bacterium]|nr:hypothetical protein [bacterium]
MDKDGNLYYCSYYYDYRTEQERYSEDESWTGPTHNISHLRGNMDGDPYGEYDNVNFARGVSGELYMSVYDDRIAKIVRADSEGFSLDRTDFPVYNFDVAKCPDGRTILFGKGYSGESIGTLYYSIIGEKKLPLKAKLLVYNNAGELHESEDYVPEEGDLFTVKLKLYRDDNGELIETSRGYDEDRMVGFNLFGASASEEGRGFAFTDTLGGVHSGYNYSLLEKGENMVESEYQVVCTNPENALATVYAGVYEEYEPLLMSRTLNRTTAPVSDPIDEDTYEIARNRNLVGKIVFCKSDDTEVDPTEYLPANGDTFKVKYILEYDDGSEFTGYDEDKTVKFSLEGTKSGEMPLEFVWYDDSTEMKSVTLYGGQTEVDCPLNLKSTSYFGVAGVSAAVYPYETDPENSSEPTAETRKELPEDIDNDNMADSWEREYLEFYNYTDIEQFKPEDDIEKNDKIGAIGDGLTNLSEYMGYWLDGTDYRLEPNELEILYKETMPFPLTSKNYCEKELSLKVIEIPGSLLFKLNDRISAKKTIWPEREDVRTVINDDGILTDSYGDQDGTTKGYMYPYNVGTGGGEFIIYLGTLNNFLGGKEELENQFQQKNLVYKNWVHESFGSNNKKYYSVTFYSFLNKNDQIVSKTKKIEFDGTDINGDGEIGWVNIMDILDNSEHQSDDLIFEHGTEWFINKTFLHELGHLFGLGHFIRDPSGKIIDEFAIISLDPLSKPSVMLHGLCGHSTIDELRYSEDEKKLIVLKEK